MTTATATDLKETGLDHFRHDRLTEAAECFEQAARLFAEQGDAASAAEMKNNLGVVHLGEKNYEAALAAFEGTPEVFRAAGDALREAQATGNLGAAYDGLGRLDEAAAHYEKAIEMYTRLGETENRAACWKALSALQVKQDKKLQALASMQAGLNLSPNLSVREKTLKGLIDKAMKLMGRQ